MSKEKVGGQPPPPGKISLAIYEVYTTGGRLFIIQFNRSNSWKYNTVIQYGNENAIAISGTIATY